MIDKLSWKFFCFLAMCAVMVFDILFLSIDVFILGELSEIGFVETAQSFYLAAIFLGFFHFSDLDDENSGFFVLVGGFFACMFIRELDVYFDIIRHGSWKIPALIMAFICICYAFSKNSFNEIVASLVNFMKTPQFGLMLGGILCILVFSRLFGMRLLWEVILNYNYNGTAKTVAEETCELFGYTLAFLSTVWLGFERNFFKFK